MIDTFSTSIGVAQLLLDIYNTLRDLPKQQNDSAKLAKTRYVVGKLTNISLILRESKTIHDKFENLRFHVQEKIERIHEAQNIDEISPHVKEILDEIDRNLIGIDSRLKYSLCVETGVNFDPLPDATNEGLRHLPNCSQKLYSNLNSFNQNHQVLRNLFDQNSFEEQEEQFDTCLNNLSLAMQNVILYASKVIFYTAPMLNDLNHDLYQSLPKPVSFHQLQLHLFSLLKRLYSRRIPAIKIDEMREVIKDIDQIGDVFRKVKELHYNTETMFYSTVNNQIDRFLKTEEEDDDSKSCFIDCIVKVCEEKSDELHPTLTLWINDSQQNQLNNEDISSILRGEVKDAFEHLPKNLRELKTEIANFDSYYQNLKKLQDESSYGGECRNCLKFLRGSITNLLVDADKVIRNISVILIYANERLEGVLKSP